MRAGSVIQIVALVGLIAAVVLPAWAQGGAEPAGAEAGTIAAMRERALRGDARTQYMLARRYAAGEDVAADPVEAYFWFNIAARGGIAAAVRQRDAIGATLSASEFISVQTRVREWVAAHGGATPGAAAREQRPAASATGFVVDSAGHALTSAHAIAGCTSLTVQGAGNGRADVQAWDADLDLALLRLDGAGPPPAPLGDAAPVRLGAEVVVFGYPLQGVLANGANVTDGIVSGLAGPANDGRLFQHTAPVQPGNGGSPLLDRSGAVIGVAVAKLNSWQMAQRLGDLPQNINFGLRAGAVRDFLAAHGIAPDGAGGGVRLSIAEIAERAGRFTLLLECWQ